MSLLEKEAKRVSKRRTICEVIREMYDLLAAIKNETIREELKVRLEQSYEMAKKMDRRLHQYKFRWDDDFWEANTNWKQDLQRRQHR